MLKCEGIQSEISAYLDREMPLWKTRLIKRHLGQCPTCAHEVMRIRQTDEVLRRLDSVKTSENFVSEVMRRGSEARADEKLRTSPLRRVRRRLESTMAWPRYSVFKRAPSFTFAAMFALLLILGTFATVYNPHGMRLFPDDAQLFAQSPVEDSTLVWIDIIATDPPKRYLSINQRTTPQPGSNTRNQRNGSRQL